MQSPQWISDTLKIAVLARLISVESESAEQMSVLAQDLDVRNVLPPNFSRICLFQFHPQLYCIAQVSWETPLVKGGFFFNLTGPSHLLLA